MFRFLVVLALALLSTRYVGFATRVRVRLFFVIVGEEFFILGVRVWCVGVSIGL